MSTTVISQNGTGFVDAFGRSRVSNPMVSFASKFLFDTEPLRWNEATGGAGSIVYNQDRATVRLLTSAAAVDSALRQSKYYVEYTPGNSQLIFLQFTMAPSVAGLVQRVGQFDDDNGLYFEDNGNEATPLAFVRRTNVTGSVENSRIPQTDWNLDKLDGTGSSGITLNPQLIQGLVIDWLWPSGRIRLGFHLGGTVVYAHEIEVANTLAFAWSSSPKLPLRWEIFKTAPTADPAELAQIGATVISEELHPDAAQGQVRSFVRRTPGVSIGTVFEPILSVRLNPATFRATLRLLALTVGNSTSGDFFWALLINPVYTAETVAPVWMTLPNSVAQVDVTRDATISALDFDSQIIVASGYSDAAINREVIDIEDDILLNANLDGTIPDIATIVARNVAGGAETYFGSLTWRELT